MAQLRDFYGSRWRALSQPVCRIEHAVWHDHLTILPFPFPLAAVPEQAWSLGPQVVLQHVNPQCLPVI